jgi:excisionase family DNA binding protein
MSEPHKNPFDAMLDAFRQVVREELASALKAALNGHRTMAEKDWLRADECANLYGLPKTWFEERGRAGEIARTKPGRYVLFSRRAIEKYLEEHQHQAFDKRADSAT